MLDISNGFFKISDELTIFPGFLFEQFKHTRFYKNQDGLRIIYLDEQQIIKIKIFSDCCCNCHFDVDSMCASVYPDNGSE